MGGWREGVPGELANISIIILGSLQSLQLPQLQLQLQPCAATAAATTVENHRTVILPGFIHV